LEEPDLLERTEKAVTGDETWVFQYNTEIKYQRLQQKESRVS
jgi:hypothetical protein